VPTARLFTALCANRLGTAGPACQSWSRQAPAPLVRPFNRTRVPDVNVGTHVTDRDRKWTWNSGLSQIHHPEERFVMCDH
jgi:hypothetical protein